MGAAYHVNVVTRTVAYCPENWFTFCGMTCGHWSLVIVLLSLERFQNLGSGKLAHTWKLPHCQLG